MKSWIYILIFFTINTAYALDVDEKLTLRFLKVSASKKTILINRGAEDGLVVGNHAKFFLTAGVIARGVVEKVSPSRSIWSLYRIIDPGEITDGKVLNLKIGTPVKISEDSSKSLGEELTSTGRERMSMSAKKMNSKKAKEVDAMEEDFDSQEEAAIPVAKINTASENKEYVATNSKLSLWELWGNAGANMLSGNATDINIGTLASTTPSKSSAFDLSLGIEKYFYDMRSFFNQFTLTGFVHSRSSTIGQDIQVAESLLEFGAGIRYHFSGTAGLTNTIMPFGLFDFGMGSITLTNTVISGTSTSESSVKGSNKFFALGGGAKYVLRSGLGFKSIIDYYSSSETYAYTSTTGTRSLAGFRLQAGLSYRF